LEEKQRARKHGRLEWGAKTGGGKRSASDPQRGNIELEKILWVFGFRGKAEDSFE